MDDITVGADEIRSLVGMPDAIAAVREGLLGLHAGEFELPIRTIMGDGRFLVMSVHHRPTRSALFKTLSLNFDGRNPAIVGTVVWSEFDHARQLIAAAPAITALRTGAIVGVATDLLARPDAGSCTMIGAGAQAIDQIRAVHAVRPLTLLTVVDRDVDRARAVADAARAELGIPAVTVADDADAAVRDADIVCCATTATAPLFSADSVAPQAHVNAIGSYRSTMRELPDELLADAAVLVVDEKEAVLEEAGEIIHGIGSGAIRADDLCELGAALAQSRPRPAGRTVFKTVGVAVQDWAIGHLLARRCLADRAGAA